MVIMRLLLLGIVGGIVLVGCGDGGVVGGDDAGPAADAGPAIDSGPPIDTGPRVDAGPPPTVRALFVGNSYTFFNELPTVVREIGAASGVNLEVEMIAPGGARLAD